MWSLALALLRFGLHLFESKRSSQWAPYFLGRGKSGCSAPRSRCRGCAAPKRAPRSQRVLVLPVSYMCWSAWGVVACCRCAHGPVYYVYTCIVNVCREKSDPAAQVFQRASAVHYFRGRENPARRSNLDQTSCCILSQTHRAAYSCGLSSQCANRKTVGVADALGVLRPPTELDEDVRPLLELPCAAAAAYQESLSCIESSP